MRAYEKKKAFRKMLKELSKQGFMNSPSGQMVRRGTAPDNQMRRDYYPQNQG